METRHNTTLLEKAIGLVVEQAAIPTRKAEADASFQMARAAGLRRVATGGAVAIAAVGIGLAAWLALDPGEEQVSQVPDKPDKELTTSSVEKPATDKGYEAAGKPGPASKRETAGKDPAPNASASSGAKSPGPTPGPAATPGAAPVPAPPPKPEIITTNYSKFVTKTTTVLGRDWVVEAGHHFASETDANWSYAWCYTRAVVDRVTINVELASRTTPQLAPLTRLATPQTLAKAGLDDNSVRILTEKCPWLDGKDFSSEEKKPAPASVETEIVKLQ
jgi:hypothetical protein